MSVSRRQVLQQSILAVAACAVSPLPAWAGTTKTPPGNSSHPPTPGPEPDRAKFTRAIGSGFKVTPTSGKESAVWLRLLAVQDLPPLVPVNPGSMAVPPKQKSAPIQTTGFMLSFLGPSAQPLPQGTYIFEHAAMAKFSLLIVPDGQGRETYTAVINRLP